MENLDRSNFRTEHTEQEACRGHTEKVALENFRTEHTKQVSYRKISVLSMSHTEQK